MVLVLLAGTALLYLWNLSASGTANSFYAAAVEAGTKSWKAFFFGSLDSSNFITVDKPPASLWVMDLSGRIFGFSSWSLLAPQALEGVAAVGLLYATVRRWSGPAAGLLAGAVLALTPAAALMFRFDNPDALLVLLLIVGAYAIVRALEDGATRWLLLAGSALGLAFLTKMLEGFLVLPAFVIVYLVAAPTPLRRRIGQLFAAGGALIVSAGWWVTIVELWPASSRPYIGGSTDNNVLELVLGYNGFGRLFGGSGNGGGGGETATGTSGSSFGGATGLQRLFSSEMGDEISWLLPAALIALVFGLWITRRAPRTDRTRAALILWGSSLMVTGIVFSYMEGTIHPYYTVALAAPIAALVAVGGRTLWQQRARLTARIGLAAMIAAAGIWGFVLLARDSSWFPELRYADLALTVVSALGLLVGAHRLRRASTALLIVAIIGGLGGSAAYAGATAASVHTGSVPTVGPTSAAGATGGIGSAGGFGGGGTRPTGADGVMSETRPSGATPSGTKPSGTGTTQSKTSGSSGTAGTGTAGTGTAGTALTTLLTKSTTRWSAAVIGDQSAATLELSSGTAVMAIGGWSGSDPTPTLAQFQADVRAGEIHYFIAGSSMGGGSTGTGTAIAAWVSAHYKATTVGGETVYDLSSATTS
jgi:4-amino-4-deoxy-L-arabinose transferase-like glycosyltransferase